MKLEANRSLDTPDGFSKSSGICFFGMKFEYPPFLMILTQERIISFSRKPLMMAVERSFEKEEIIMSWKISNKF